MSSVPGWPRTGIAQPAFLHVSAVPRKGHRRHLSDDQDLIARGAGITDIVVSATRSENTVRLYRSRGYQLIAQAPPELH